MRFATPESTTRPALEEGLGRLVADGRSYLDALPADTFFAPQGKAWSPAEHIRHLRTSTLPIVLSLRMPKSALTLLFGRPHFPSRTFEEIRTRYLEALARGGTAGIFTPRREPPAPHPEQRRTQIMTGWTHATEALERAIRRWSEADLGQYRLPHPLIGKLTVREMLAFTVYHTAHHLNRIAERHEGARP